MSSIVQSMRFDGHAALSLAVFLLSNHSLGQVNDWMAEIYPRWVAAHGVMILCPVNWYQAPSSLKLMIDRLVCADGGNPDPTLTGGKIRSGPSRSSSRAGTIHAILPGEFFP